MNATILSCGDELVLGQTVDTNSAYLSGQLARLGIDVLYHISVGDDRAAIARAVREAARASELVFISGGLGPTADDLTRHALADALDAPLVLDAASLEAIRAFFASRGRSMPELNAIQAMHPAGTSMVPNTCGTAPGIRARLGTAAIYAAPGVPRELYAMFERSIRPELEALPDRQAIITTTLHTFGMGESSLAERLGILMERARNPRVGTTVSGGIVSVRIASRFASIETARNELEQTVSQVRAAAGHVLFGRDGETLQHVVAHLLAQRQLSLATIEEASGGWLGRLITEDPAARALYAGGWILGGATRPIPELASTSSPAAPLHPGPTAAAALAEAALARAHSDLALSVTGAVEPGDAAPDTPLGTTWIGLADRRDSASAALVVRADLPGDLDAIRDRAARCALQLLRFHLLRAPLDDFLWVHRFPS